MKLDFALDEYIKKLRKSDNAYFHTFLNLDSLAVGVLVLRPGDEDTQEPHESDEVYLILNGDGFLKINGKDYAVSPDKVFFVGKNIEHCFHANTKEIVALYFFGGPDS